MWFIPGLYLQKEREPRRHNEPLSGVRGRAAACWMFLKLLPGFKNKLRFSFSQELRVWEVMRYCEAYKSFKVGPTKLVDVLLLSASHLLFLLNISMVYSACEGGLQCSCIVIKLLVKLMHWIPIKLNNVCSVTCSVLFILRLGEFSAKEINI